MRAAVRPTAFLDLPFLAETLGLASLTIASEAHQWTGSFKFRAANEVAKSVPNQTVIAASSGNFGQALAFACSLYGRRAIIVMPSTSAEVKVAGVRRYGGEVELVDVSQISRAERARQLAALHPDAYVASAYDDPLVIRGNSSLGREIAESELKFDAVIAPVGGGGLSAGIITGLREARSAVTVIGAEPEMADDAYRSLRTGEIVANSSEPPTIADGARTLSVGKHNWPILRDGLARIIPVSEDGIIDAVRTLYDSHIKAEPTGALALGAALRDVQSLAGMRVCAVMSGANVDAGVYAKLIAPHK